MFTLIAAIVCVVLIWSVLGQATTYANVSQQNKQSMERCRQNQAAWAKQKSQEKDIYYNPVSGCLDSSYYSDGSLRYDPYTKREYGKGAYYYNSRGYDAQWRQAPADAKRPSTN